MASDTGGVKAFSLQGRLYRERERLRGMSEEERSWRARWLRDQRLCGGEPLESRELYVELHNPIRRLIRAPLNLVESALRRVVGAQAAYTVRKSLAGTCIITALIYSAAYYLKYCSNDWTRKGGWRVLTGRPQLLSHDPGYPAKYDRTKPSHYANRGFQNSPI